MGKSFKKNLIVKDKKPKNNLYWKTVRSSVKNKLRSMDIEEIEEGVIPDVKEIVNDYNYRDYEIHYDKDSPQETLDKIKRK